ncbi:MAG: methyltransferase domain-containing protein [Phycisphaerae bacterium]|nr:methyltransferase domain-containing protein [Phycisphaerae bacterium]NUQ46271.1 methyltransferase domain-containing protein [Phycisphaerae bacterium]
MSHPLDRQPTAVLALGDLLDTRPSESYLAGHDPRAANIPLEELAVRVHELPARRASLRVYDDPPVRARWARSRLRARGFEDVAVVEASDRTAWIEGPSRVRLWSPHEWLVQALPLIEDSPTGQRRALDLACGTGRDAVWLAMQGWNVDAWDVLPDALERAADRGRRCGVSIQTRVVDLEPDALGMVSGEYDLVVGFNYLHRPLFEWIQRAVRPGGWLVYETFVEPQRIVFGKPRRRQFVLQPGELKERFAFWDIVRYAEGPSGPRRIAAGIVARSSRKPCP